LARQLVTSTGVFANSVDKGNIMIAMDGLRGTSDRAVGALVGLAIGDALGAPVEFQPRGTFEPVTDLRAGGYFKLPAGAWTDDTAMALCLAESLLEHPSFSPQDLLDRFCRWASNGENTSTSVCVGIGQNTLRVLGNFHRNGTLFAPETRQKSDGNGAAMRLAPVALRHWRNPLDARSIAILQSRTTHYSDLSASACEYLAAILCELIAGRNWSDALRVRLDLESPETILEIANETWHLRSPDSISSSGYVVHTLEAAIWAVETTDSFEEAVLKAVNLGDDADSVGAVAGQLAGARYGLSEIPLRWRDGLAQSKRIVSIAEALVSAGSFGESSCEY
jgi:ADP-ribosyl-[dinitrogen reductase] hydrolase